MELNSWRCGISVQFTLHEPDRWGPGPETLSVVGVCSGHGQSLFALEPCLAVLTVGRGGPVRGPLSGEFWWIRWPLVRSLPQVI